MTSYRVKLKGAPKIIEVEAETFEEQEDPFDPQGGDLVAKDGTGKVIAKFNRREVTGWWIEQENKVHHTITFVKPEKVDS